MKFVWVVLLLIFIKPIVAIVKVIWYVFSFIVQYIFIKFILGILDLFFKVFYKSMKNVKDFCTIIRNLANLTY